MLSYAILASAIVSAISLISIIVLFKKSRIDKYIKSFIGIASGVLLASVFLELLPEVFETVEFKIHTFFATMLLSILGFYLIERLIHWHHCHGASCPPENKLHVAVTNLLGDGIHNFVDGVLIGAAFLVSPGVGIATTIAIIAHEIPQEISDASVLIYAGLSKIKVIGFNLLFALTSIIGAVFAYLFIGQSQKLIPFFIAIAAGNFIYLALSDLIPELHHDHTCSEIIKHTLLLFLGVIAFWIITLLIGRI